MSNPYSTFGQYWSAGWRGILPLPYGKKGFPPEGFTGYAGREPSYPDCQAWSEDGPRNLGLRMPADCAGIDVDHYDGKAGGDTLARLVAKFGALPPTVMSTSREDGISGIRLYRIPPGTTLPTKLPGIEFIQRHHRYAVAWPSIHPSGRVYRWIDERTGQVLDGPPRLADLPMLPASWIAGLAVEARNHEKAALGADQALAMLHAMPTGPPCAHVLAHAGKVMAGGDRHDSYNEAALAVVGAGRRGCPGAAGVVQRLRDAFVAEVTGPRGRATVAEAEAEWRRGILGALSIVAAEPQGTVCPDDVLNWIDDTATTTEAPEEAPERSPYELAVARKVGELRVLEDAREALAGIRAGQALPLTGHTLPVFLAQPDVGERYRIDRLWPTEGRVLCPAAAKSGKTTLIVGNLIPSLVDGRLFLGQFTVVPVTRRIVYFNLEVGERTLRAWLRDAGIANAGRVTVVNLRGKVSALGLDSAAGRARLAAFLRSEDAEVAILDPLAPALAAFGLDENSNSDVATFFAWWSETLGIAGVIDDFIAHHAGHAGQRSRGASRLLDEPDAIWTITSDTAEDDGNDDIYGAKVTRYLQAMGRDVDIPATALGYAPDNRTLTFREGISRAKGRGEGRRQAVIQWVRDHPGRARTAIKDGVGGNAKTAWDTIDALIDEGELLPVGKGWHVND